MRVDDQIDEYMRHAAVYYAGSRELLNMRKAMEWVRRSGIESAEQLDAKRLKAIRAAMIEDGLSRSYINQMVGKIRRAWRWLEAEGHIPPGASEHLRVVESLRRGRTAAVEGPGSGPVQLKTVIRTIEVLPAPYAAIVELMLSTGARVSEILVMRTGDIDQRDAIWWFEPCRHKSAHRGRERAIPLDERAQAAVLDYLLPFAPRAWVFPAPGSGGARPISASAVYHAIRRATTAHGIPAWHPHQTRHAAATLAHAGGADPDSIQDLLGHASAATTERYIRRITTRGSHAIPAIRKAIDAHRPR